MAPLFLGLDSSTQALKASLLEYDLSVLSEIEVRFDCDLSHFGTKGGTLHGPPDSGIVYSPVMIVVEAMDLLFERIKAAQWPVHEIRGISAAGQQHASVYWSQQATSLLANMDATKSIASQLQNAFSRATIPNWQDSSTLSECHRLEESVGGAERLANLTGSRAHTRFTGPQIMRFMATEPEAYNQTSRISLVSSFITTLLCLDGEIKGIDESDACGMNMWNMCTPERGWDKEVLTAIAGEKGRITLENKLGRVESDGGRVVGHIGKWFVDRYNFSSQCIVCPGTGDNPATFLSFTLKEKEGLISLGTSDTVLVSTSFYHPDPAFHAFFHPAQIVSPTLQEQESGLSHFAEKHAGKGKRMSYFNMLVYKNGSLAREYIRDQYFDSSWDLFNQAVESSRPKNAKDLPTQIGFWWLKPDIIPSNASGTFKYVCPRNSTPKSVPEFESPSTNAIAILESQMLNYQSRVSSILGEKSDDDARLGRVFATGGAAKNPVICSVMADVLGCNVCKPVTYQEKEKRWNNADWNACSVAAGYKAAWAWTRHSTKEDKWIDFEEFVKKCSEKRKQSRLQAEINEEGQSETNRGLELLEEGVAIVARPDEERMQAYSQSVDWWKLLESKAWEESRSPSNVSIKT
jgi:xylulokinase